MSNFGYGYDLLCVSLNSVSDREWKVHSTTTVLINSNFRCNFYINRATLYQRLRDHYKLNSAYDPCSYPGIQSEFYYRQDMCCPSGKQPPEIDKKTFLKLSFMVFRTGSVLIVGKCNEEALTRIYSRIKSILIDEYPRVKVEPGNGAIPRNPRSRAKKKRTVLVPPE